MTQVFRADGSVVPVTRISATPLTVTQIKTEKNGTPVAVQVGCGVKKHPNKALLGHLKDLPSHATLREFPTSQNLKRGDTISLETFTAGDLVDAIGISKGRGFAGVVKRHHFRGGPASHGHKDNLRAPGSIGAGGVQRVFKGMRMAGHMGDARITVKNLEIVAVDSANNEILVKGAVPGARNSVIILQSLKGDVKVQEAPVTEAVAEVTEAV